MIKSTEFGTSIWYLTEAYLLAKETVINYGFNFEIEMQRKVNFEQIPERDFLEESAWVILSSGMRESVIRKIFPNISNAFFDWKSSERIYYNQSKCYNLALKYFNNPGKIKAIIKIAEEVYISSFASIKISIKEYGIKYLMKFPYIGPATSYHLAKNIGLNVAKPDRHLIRITNAAGYPDPHKLCAELSEVTGDEIPVIDLVIWRYATLEKNYMELFYDGIH